MRPLTVAIVGADYPNKRKRGPTRRFELAICQRGEPIDLRPEPDNPADEHAIAVFSCRGLQLGYLPSERAVLVGKLMREGCDVVAVFQEHAPFGGYARLAFDGAAPELPPLSVRAPQPPSVGEGADPEPDFYPDPDYDD